MSVFDEDGVGVTRVRFRQPRFRWVTPYIRTVLSAAEELHRSFRFELVHAHCAFPAGVAALCVAMRYRVPLFVTEHWGPYEQLMSSSWATSTAIRTVVRRAAAAVAVSGALRREMQRWTGRQDIRIVPPAVDVDLFRPQPGDSQGPAMPVRLLFVGRLNDGTKRLEDLLAALAMLQARSPHRRWHLEVVGGGYLQPQYEAQAAALGIAESVIFRGQSALATVSEAMRRCSMLVVPSTYETFGVVYAEALACGRPVVATRCGGPEDFVTDAVGRLVERCDPQGLASAIENVATCLASFQPERLRSFAVSRFSYEVIGRRYLAIYRDVME